MALFQQSTKTIDTIQAIVADSANASGDSVMKARALRAMDQAVEKWQNADLWSFLLTDASDISVTASAGADWALPSDFRAMYSVRLASVPRALSYIDQRYYDRADPTQTASTPTSYTLFAVGGVGKIRLIPPPSANDTLKLRYYRRMTLPSGIATASAIDIPQDYEYGVISLAKYFFLLDKGGPTERIQGHLNEGIEAIKQARGRERMGADETMAFVPSWAVSTNPDPNSINTYLWDS